MAISTESISPVKKNGQANRKPGKKRNKGLLTPLLNQVDAREYRLFRALDNKREDKVLVSDLLEVIARSGLNTNDVRLRNMMNLLGQYNTKDELYYDDFCRVIRPNILLIEQALQGNLVIPDFEKFRDQIRGIYNSTKDNREGNVADYIPKLARVDPNLFGVALCTVDGQSFSIGDSKIDFSVQSSSKPSLYCLALEEHGEEGVHKYVGREPSGRNFNELTLASEGKPHNPMINAGAILCASLIRPELDAADRFDYMLNKWKALCGSPDVKFNNSIYQSERKTADRNFALG